MHSRADLRFGVPAERPRIEADIEPARYRREQRAQRRAIETMEMARRNITVQLAQPEAETARPTFRANDRTVPRHIEHDATARAGHARRLRNRRVRIRHVLEDRAHHDEIARTGLQRQLGSVGTDRSAVRSHEARNVHIDEKHDSTVPTPLRRKRTILRAEIDRTLKRPPPHKRVDARAAPRFDAAHQTARMRAQVFHPVVPVERTVPRRNRPGPPEIESLPRRRDRHRFGRLAHLAR